jgi:hypothetical protein
MVFNGYGAQETCDMLVNALIYPTMPAFAVCSDDPVWARFKTAVFGYQKERVEIVMTLPYVSGPRPFRFNKDSHGRFLVHVFSYRRSHVKVNQDTLTKIQSLGLLDPGAMIQNNGIAKGEFGYLSLTFVQSQRMVFAVPDNSNSTVTLPSVPKVRTACKRVKLPNFVVGLPAGSMTVNVYTPFTALPHASWQATMVSYFSIGLMLSDLLRLDSPFYLLLSM